MFSRVSNLVPLIGQLSNLRFLATLGELLTCGNPAVPVRVCKQIVPAGRKFVNQARFNLWRDVPPAVAETLAANFPTRVLQLAREYGVALTTLKRLLRKDTV